MSKKRSVFVLVWIWLFVALLVIIKRAVVDAAYSITTFGKDC